MRKLDSFKKILVLWMAPLGYLFQAILYGWFWINYYYPVVSRPTISRDGYVMGGGLKLYMKGHLLIILIYFALLLLASRTFGGSQVGYLKKLDVFTSQIFELGMVNVISYCQISLMNNWLVPVRPIVTLFVIQLLFAWIWTWFSERSYRIAFPPRELLIIYGERSVRDILAKFESRKDMFSVRKCMNISEGLKALEAECENGYGAVVLWDIPASYRNDLIKFCYARSIRIYMMPKITDVLIQGAGQMHLFDTPILVIRDYALKTEQRWIKRMIDIVCALILLILASPFMLVTAVCIKAYDHGPALYKQIRCTENGREFEILKFRSMRVDAEKDGVARLAAQNDSRITPIGSFIRKVRIDELPQLINILRGDMSFIGPRPERPEIIAQYMEDMPEFAFRMKVRAGLAGYAQVYGKYNTTPYDKLKLDLAYIQNYSVWLDLKLMLLTLKILLRPESTEGVSADQITAMKNEEYRHSDEYDREEKEP